MTRKDYELIAEIIKGGIQYERDFSKNQEKVDGFKYLALTFASALGANNPRFDRVRFLSACGLEA